MKAVSRIGATTRSCFDRSRHRPEVPILRDRVVAPVPGYRLPSGPPRAPSGTSIFSADLSSASLKVGLPQLVEPGPDLGRVRRRRLDDLIGHRSQVEIAVGDLGHSPANRIGVMRRVGAFELGRSGPGSALKLRKPGRHGTSSRHRRSRGALGGPEEGGIQDPGHGPC